MRILLPGLLTLLLLLAACPDTGPDRLAAAIKHGDFEQYSALIERRGNVDEAIGGEWYWPPLQQAAFHGQLDILSDLLARGADINLGNAKDGATALHAASNQRNHEIVKLLLERGADISAQDQRGRTALHNAAIFEDAELVNLLLERGSPVNLADTDGKSALLLAAERFEPQMLAYLLEHGSDPAITAADGRNALHVVVANGDEASLRVLLEHGVELEAEDGNGDRALHIACRNGNEAVVELLLRYGADPAVHNAAGRLPEELAEPWPLVLELLERHGLERLPLE